MSGVRWSFEHFLVGDSGQKAVICNYGAGLFGIKVIGFINSFLGPSGLDLGPLPYRKDSFFRALAGVSLVFTMN